MMNIIEEEEMGLDFTMNMQVTLDKSQVEKIVRETVEAEMPNMEVDSVAFNLTSRSGGVSWNDYTIHEFKDVVVAMRPKPRAQF